jgi:DNA-binding transcriptional ArsR family regulator
VPRKRELFAATAVFKALSDPIRWNIVQQIAEEEEFACSILEDTLPVSKTTISYHTKILTQAGLIEVRKRGRNYFYTLRRDTLDEAIGELSSLGPGKRPADGRAPTREPASASASASASTSEPASAPADPPEPAPGGTDITLVTW